MKIRTFISGHGRSASVVAKSLAILKTSNPPWELDVPVWLDRGQSLRGLNDRTAQTEHSVLFACGPHGLHARAILDARDAKISCVVTEKPLCTNTQDLKALNGVKIPVAVLHVYRQMWGPQKLRELIQSKSLGKIFSYEGRYWQSSAAKRTPQTSSTWKDDPALSGPHDVLLDLGTHWIDMIQFLAGQSAKTCGGHLIYGPHSGASHRDTHVQLDLLFGDGARGWGSVSKAVHGAGNFFEVNVLGEGGSASWNFQNPDQITIGEGGEKRTLTRTQNELGSGQPAFHGMGWVEGYIEIIRQAFNEVAGLPHLPYPTLQDGLRVMDTAFSVAAAAKDRTSH